MMREQYDKKERELNDERNKVKKLMDQMKDYQHDESRHKSVREDELYQEIERLNYVV